MRRDSIAVCLCAVPNTGMRIVTTTPLVVVEVLSPEDRIANDDQRAGLTAAHRAHPR